MKALVPVILLLAVAAGGYWFYTTQMGGSAEVGAPTNAPDLPDVGVPDAESAADGARKAADEIAGLPQVVWTTYVPVGIFALACWWVWKDAKRRSIALGVALVALVVFLIGRTG